MAGAAGVEMTECRLLPEGPRTHFLTRRFDRLPGGERIHLLSLCAMAHLDFLVVDLLALVRQLECQLKVLAGLRQGKHLQIQYAQVAV